MVGHSAVERVCAEYGLHRTIDSDDEGDSSVHHGSIKPQVKVDDRCPTEILCSVCHHGSPISLAVEVCGKKSGKIRWGHGRDNECGGNDIPGGKSDTDSAVVFDLDGVDAGTEKNRSAAMLDIRDRCPEQLRERPLEETEIGSVWCKKRITEYLASGAGIDI